MKKLLSLLLIASSISCTSPTSSNNESTDSNIQDSVLSKEELLTKVDTINFTGADGLKQGKWIENNYSKNPSEGVYKNSLKEGIWTEYYDQHRLTIKNRITYVNGKMEGTAVLFDSLTHDPTTGEYVGGKFIPDSKSK